VEDALRVAVQWLHVTAGVLWIGGGFYTVLVQLPALLATPPPARGPAMVQLAPRQFGYILRVAELTIATGILNLIVTGRAAELTRLDTRWSWAILAGFLLAVFVYGLVRARLRPWVLRMIALGPQAAGGDATAAAEAGALMARIRRLGYVQLAIGLAILLAMVIARFS
jgi:uncharacterized membrane protein